MKKFYLAAALCWLATFTIAQVRTRSVNPEALKEYSRFVSTSKKALRSVQVSKVDVSALLKEDEKEAGWGLPPRFGKDLDVNFNLSNSGSWEDVDGGRVWRLLIHVPEAKTVNMIFDRFYLPEGAQLFISNSERTMVAGPIDHTQNSLSGIFSTSLIKGHSVIIELFEPTEFYSKSILQVSKVIHGYKSTPFAGFGQAAPDPCERNVNCPEGNNWQAEKGMVAMVLLQNNTRHCSGSLLNNTCNNLTPNFLTAFHCIDVNQNGVRDPEDITRAQTFNFMFQYMSAGCTPSTDDLNFVSFSGATHRASWNVSDFALLELNQTPEPGTGVAYAGWSRTNAAPTSSVSLHHPQGDVMKISFENNVATSVNWNGGAPNTHWGVNFDTGTVEGGSSGSPLFNQNHRVVGQLHGGPVINGQPHQGKCINREGSYGRFDVSWNGGGTNDTRLSNWLDPSGSGATEVGPLTIPSISGPSILCTSGAYTLNNVPAGVPVTWSVTTPSGVTPTSGSGNVANLTMVNPEDVTLTFRIGCNATRGITRRLLVGPPQFGGFLVNGQSTSNGTGCTNSYIPIAAVPNDPSASYYWSQSDPNGFIANASQSSTAFTGYNGSCYYLNVGISNACGSRSEYLTICLSDCFAKYTVYPNPAKDFITVDFDKIESVESLPDEIVLMSEKSTKPVKNIDVQALYQRNGLKNGKQVEIDAKALPRGTYYLHIKNSRLKENKVDVIRILLE